MRADIKKEIKPLFALMLPIMITQLAQTGLGLIDTIMAGRLSPNDLASIGVAVGIWLPVMLFFMGILLATTPLIAKAKGENRPDEMVKVAQHSLILAFGLGLLAMGVMWVLPSALPLLSVPVSLIPKASDYLFFISFGLPASLLYASLRCYSESLGVARPVTVIALLALPIMVPVNYAFMYGAFGMPRLGGAGAGLATAIIQWLSLFALVGYICWAKFYQSVPIFGKWHRGIGKLANDLPNLSNHLTDNVSDKLPDSSPNNLANNPPLIPFAFDKSYLAKIAKLGIPIGLSVFFEVAIFSTASIVIAPLGDTVVASHQVTLSITSVLFMIPMSLAMALTIRVGVHFGERNRAGLLAVQKLGFMVATLFASLTMLGLFVLRPEIVGIYSDDVAVASLAVQLTLFAVAYQLVDAWQVCATGCLRGLQDTQVPMWIMLFVYWGVAFPVGFYLVRVAGVGAWGIWAGFIVGLSLASVALVGRLFRVNKRVMGGW